MDDFVHGVTERTKQNGGNGRKNLAQHIAEMRAYNPPPDPPEPSADPTQPQHESKYEVAPEFADLPVEDFGEDISSGANRDEWNVLVDQARAIDMLAVAQAHGAKLRKSGREYFGACPVCGTGDDRFAINPSKGTFLCRKCHPEGGGGPIDLEMFLSGCEFR